MAPDVALAWPLKLAAFLLAGAALVAFALYLRLRVFKDNEPGGVDTWYYLASAQALRRQKRLPISLPQYLLHDRYESYPAGFPVFLAFLPERWLRARFWLVAPLVDVLHLALLYLLTFRLTDSVLAASTAGLIYAVTPQLISETRNLNGRAFASLLQTLAMLALLRSAIPSEGPTRTLIPESEPLFLGLAAVLVGLLYNTHTSTTIAFVVSCTVLTVVSGNPRFLGIALLGLPLAIVLSRGYYLHVIRNHVQAARFWFRNVSVRRAHQVDDSPVLQRTRLHLDPVGASSGVGVVNRAPPVVVWLRGQLTLLARLLGENPFILAMLLLPLPPTEWAWHMYWWAVAVLVWAFAVTFIPPLRVIGPGVHYMKASVFPSAYALSVAVNVREGPFSGVGLGVLISVLASLAALAYFYRYMATRKTEHTAVTPPDLAEAAAYLRGLPGSNVLVLPNMYADYVCYNAQKAVVWGGHSGDLRKLEEFFPVLRKPLPYFFQLYQVAYVLLDLAYTDPERLQVNGSLALLEQFGAVAVYEVRDATIAPA